MILLGIATEKGRKVELVVAALTGHKEMIGAIGKEVSKPIFLSHLSQEFQSFIPGIIGVDHIPVCRFLKKRILHSS